mmetsp:Transcript_24349/g.54250  ORF Transcript_24349/g.54250 Transcript_24349/m.54250 type:complete len:314 (+) Transcript_24349:836-1777(+)
MLQQALHHALGHGAKASFFAAVHFVRRVVVLHDGVGEHELVQGLHKGQDPERHEHVVDDVSDLWPGEFKASMDATAGSPHGAAVYIACCIQEHEAEEEHRHQDQPLQSLAERNPQHRWHVPDSFASYLHARRGCLDAAMEPAHQAHADHGEQPADACDDSSHDELVLQQLLGNVVACMCCECAGVDPQERAKHGKEDDREDHSGVDERLRHPTEDQNVEEAEENGHNENAQQNWPGFWERRQALHELRRPPDRLAVVGLPLFSHLLDRVVVRIGEAIPTRKELCRVDRCCHASAIGASGGLLDGQEVVAGDRV